MNGQKKQIGEFAKRNNLRVVGWYNDVGSAQGEDDVSSRSGFNHAMNRSLQKRQPIIVATADRFSRSLASYDRFNEAGGKLYATDEGFGVDEAVMRSRIVRAQHDGKKISERTRKGQATARANGKTFGNPRLQEARDKAKTALKKKAQENYDEFRKECLQAWAAGINTGAGLANLFNEKGYTTERGRMWTVANVGRMLRKSKIPPAPVVGAEASAVVADELLSSDRRLTDTGARRFHDALVELGAGEQQLGIAAMLKGQVLTDAAMNAIQDRIERAEASRRRRAAPAEEDQIEVDETVRQLLALWEKEMSSFLAER